MKHQIHNLMNKNIPLEDFFKNPEKTAYSLSPDGNYLAFLAPYKDRKNIFVQKIGASEVKQITKVKQGKSILNVIIY